ncbi:MAG: hypothetical protein H0U65_12790 [Rubrobacter sp.]|nr:hypothetical protein [Rubrobacter sp.]
MTAPSSPPGSFSRGAVSTKTLRPSNGRPFARSRCADGLPERAVRVEAVRNAFPRTPWTRPAPTANRAVPDGARHLLRNRRTTDETPSTEPRPARTPNGVPEAA